MTHRLTAFVFAGLATLGFAGAVLGHAELVSADPPAGGTLTATPYTLTATFDEELTADGSSLVIKDAAGVEAATGTVSPADAKVMTAELPALVSGTYTVRWTAVTSDDLAVERGTYSFTVGSAVASVTPTPTQPPGDGATSSSNDVLVAIGLAAILILVVVAFVLVRGRR